MKLRLWHWFLEKSKHSQGAKFSWWLVAISFILFPIDFLYWKMSRANGYDPMRGIWTIHGVEYSDVVFATLLKPGNAFRVVSREGKIVTVERIFEVDK